MANGIVFNPRPRIDPAADIQAGAQQIGLGLIQNEQIKFERQQAQQQQIRQSKEDAFNDFTRITGIASSPVFDALPTTSKNKIKVKFAESLSSFSGQSISPNDIDFSNPTLKDFLKRDFAIQKERSLSVDEKNSQRKLLLAEAFDVLGKEKASSFQALTGTGVSGAGRTPAERDDLALKLGDQLSKRKEVQDAISVDSNVRSMDKLLTSALKGDVQNRIALEQGLITMFNKITDPGSVVRESEFARTPENAPIVNRVVGAIQKFKSGGVGLTNADREALVIGAKVIANERFSVALRTRRLFQDQARNVGADPRIATGTTPDFKPFRIERPKFGQPKTIRIRASDGSVHSLPADNLNKAKEIDPGLEVIK